MSASLEELISVLGKSGIPLPSSAGGNGSAQDMQNAAPGAAQNIASTVQNQDTVIPGLKSSYNDQLSKIASMDQQLHSLYNDPTSKLHLNDPGQALKLSSGARNTGFQAAGFIRGAEKSQQTQLDKEASDATDLYSKLTTMQARDDAAATKAAKVAAKAGGTNSSLEDKANKAQAKADETRQTKMETAGLSDPGAIATFDNIKEAGFRTWYFKSMQDARASGQGVIPPGGFSSKDIQDSYNWWKTNVNPPKQKTTAIFSKGGGNSNSSGNYYDPSK